MGAGRVGSTLAAALGRAGHEIVAVSAVSDTSVRRVRRNLPGVAIKPPPEVVAAADLVLLTVPDDVLPGLVAGLAATGAAWKAGWWRTPAAGTAWRCSTRRSGPARCPSPCTRS